MSLQDIYCSGNGEQTHAMAVYQELRVIFGHLPWEIASGYVLLQYIWMDSKTRHTDSTDYAVHLSYM